MIILKNLTKKYGNVIALDNITVNIDKGRNGVVGPNGAGKSTLFGILAGVLKYEGYCSIEGIECRDTKRIHEIVSFSIDSPILPNVKVKELLKLAGVNDDIVYQFGAGEILKKNFNSLSAGQKKIVTLSIALGRDADYYILDEPTANLDIDKRNVFYSILVKKAKNIIISSHELSELSNFINRVIILRKGKVIYSGELIELINKYKNTVIIKTDIPDKLVKVLGNGKMFGNSVIVDDVESLEEIWDKIKDFREHIFGINKADLNIIYERMINDNI